MIEVILLFNSESYRVVVNGKSILFGKSINEGLLTPIDNLKLSKQGVIKEFPDLENNPEWRSIAIERFKSKIESMNGETDITKYIVNDLAKFGYKPLKIIRQGFRAKNIKDGKL